MCCCDKALFGVDSKVEKRVGTLEYKYIQIHLELCKYLLRNLGIHPGKWCPSISGWGCPWLACWHKGHLKVFHRYNLTDAQIQFDNYTNTGSQIHIQITKEQHVDASEPLLGEPTAISWCSHPHPTPSSTCISPWLWIQIFGAKVNVDCIKSLQT